MLLNIILKHVVLQKLTVLGVFLLWSVGRNAAEVYKRTSQNAMTSNPAKVWPARIVPFEMSSTLSKWEFVINARFTQLLFSLFMCAVMPNTLKCRCKFSRVLSWQNWSCPKVAPLGHFCKPKLVHMYLEDYIFYSRLTNYCTRLNFAWL